MAAVRECIAEDFAEVLPLLQQLWPNSSIDPESMRAAFERGLASEAQHYYCAAESGRIVGFFSLTVKSSLWQQGYLAHLDELVVDKAFRGRGLGKQLLRQAIEVARTCHANRLELDSAFHRTNAHKFYERQGFESRAFLFSSSITHKSGGS